ncbi:MAG: ABC transporter permease [Clostridia bacterium]|nr:ABC transporter permease [Clostridia bacterium]
MSGIVQSPLTFAMEGEPSYLNGEDTVIPDDTFGTKDMDLLEQILYISEDLIPTYKDIMPGLPDRVNAPIIKSGDLYVAIEDRELFDAFSSDYEATIEEKKAEIKASLEDVEVITLYENFSFKSLASYVDKVQGIGFLLAVVIYTITNINISERNREIATLMVLGYHDTEVCGYIDREVYINSFIGILFGYPTSLLLLFLVFEIIGVGTISGVSWFV